MQGELSSVEEKDWLAPKFGYSCPSLLEETVAEAKEGKEQLRGTFPNPTNLCIAPSARSSAARVFWVYAVERNQFPSGFTPGHTKMMHKGQDLEIAGPLRVKGGEDCTQRARTRGSEPKVSETGGLRRASPADLCGLPRTCAVLRTRGSL